MIDFFHILLSLRIFGLNDVGRGTVFGLQVADLLICG
jgi:hypothetical protein